MASAGFKKAPVLRPHLNLGAMFDITTGRYYRGKYGEAILNAGLANFTGIAGLPNMFKTELALFQLGQVMSRHSSAELYVHDSENTLPRERVMDRMRRSIRQSFSSASAEEIDERISMSDASVYVGDEWFEDLKAFSRERRTGSEYEITTPFYNHRAKEFIKARKPALVFLDSLSGLDTEKTQAMYDKNGASDAGLNMIAMASGNVKSRMIDQMTGVTSSAGIYATFTAHVGEQHQLDMYKPAIKKLKFLKGDLKLKKVPENFSFLTGNCWYCSAISAMVDKDKLPEYPREGEETFKGETDLLELTIVNLRGKFGPSGIPFPIVVSQSEGIKEGLSHFHLIKTNGRYGIGGNLQNYYLDLYPDKKLMRKTIRSAMEEDYRLYRAVQITSYMCQLRYFRQDIDRAMIPTPGELYERLKSKGYDWDVLLNTREFWIFNEETHPLEPLTTMDLLRMYHGFYHPYWYPMSAKNMGITLEENSFGLG